MNWSFAAQSGSASWRLTLLGLALVVLTVAGLAAHEIGTLDPEAESRKVAFVAIGVMAAFTYLAAAAIIVRHPLPRRALWLVLAVAAAMRLVVLTGPPFLSTDLYRYVWDGRVQASGTNPYRYVPTDSALAPLRDADIFPRITRADYAHTIYPPAAQALFLAVAEISQTSLAMRLAMIVFEAVAVLAMLRLLSLAELNSARVAIYAWNPVTVWEFAGNAHIDAACVGLLTLTMLARARHRNGWAGTALGVATLMKFLPLVVFPAVWQRRDRLMPIAIAAVVVGLYACYSSVGWAVMGFLPGYAAEEQLNSGSGIYWLEILQHAVRLPNWAGKLWLVGALVTLAAMSVWMAFLRPRPKSEAADIVWVASGVGIMATAATVATTPHYTWYFAWLALPCCLAPFPSVIWLSVAPIVMYHDPFHDRALHFSLIYLPFLALAIQDMRNCLWLRRSKAHPLVTRRL